MVTQKIKKVAVLGAGIMGAQIAAHFANAGIEVALLDRVVDPARPNLLSIKALEQLAHPKNRSLMSQDNQGLIKVGNFAEAKKHIKGADLIIEAVAEVLSIKHEVWSIVDKFAKKNTILATNTSGIPISQVSSKLSASRKSTFIGMHFFNPPRFMKLLELIPLSETKPEIITYLKEFSEIRLGKGVVVAKDTINFIGNRLGVYTSLDSLKRGAAAGFSLATVDALTGPLIGRPKTGTYRTGDLVGLDILANVATNMKNHPDQKLFELPAILTTLIEKKQLGQKTGGGFYQKAPEGGILEFDLETGQYRPSNKPEIPLLKATKKLTLADKLNYLFKEKEEIHAKFSWESLRNMMWYAANSIPEITADYLDVDRALVWGFNWEIGIFKIWDLIGRETVIQEIEAAGLSLPLWVKERQEPFYHEGQTLSHYPTEVSLSEEVISKNPASTFLNFGHQVLGFKIQSKHNTLTNELFQELNDALDYLEKSDYRGLIIYASGKNFSVGANLYDLLTGIKTNSWLQVTGEINYFQQTTRRLKYFSKPIVSVVQGQVLGGGAELMLHSPFVVADAESYIGLVEVGVGLIPGGGGTKEFLGRTLATARFEPDVRPESLLRERFTTIFSAFVSTSAFHGKEKGFLRERDVIVMNHDRLLAVAKEKIIYESRVGFTPEREYPLLAMGEDTSALFEAQLRNLRASNYLSDYDLELGLRLAELMTLGKKARGTTISEAEFLKLERELFIELCHQEKTQERITHMLQKGKPLRN